MTQGGMYELLKLIVILLTKQESITVKEIKEVCDLAERSLSGNLSRLVKLGVLEKTEERIHTGGRIVKYKLQLNNSTINFLMNTLYKNQLSEEDKNLLRGVK